MSDDLMLQLEAAPVIVTPDGDGGYIITPIEDDALKAVSCKMAIENDWKPSEADALYEAMCEFIARIGGSDG